MFRIKRLVINPIDDSCKPSTYDFADQTFVVGGNSSGKSSLLKTIDFLLGHSDKNKISLQSCWFSRQKKDTSLAFAEEEYTKRTKLDTTQTP